MTAAREGSALAIDTVWQDVGPDLAHELVALWTRTGAIGDATIAAARARQAVCVARGDDGTVGAVGTAVLRVVPRLRQPLYYYRQYFAPGLRGLGQAVPFLNHARRVLEAHDAARPKPEAIGVLLELENPRLASRYDRAVIPEAGATYVGISARGLPLFAAYFEHARLRTR